MAQESCLVTADCPSMCGGMCSCSSCVAHTLAVLTGCQVSGEEGDAELSR